MKKYLVKIILLALCAVMCLAVFGCGKEEKEPGKEVTPSEPAVYTIQYTDDTGTHVLSVKYGDPFAIETLPSRYGYDFIGLFDAEVGGTQYVSASGSSLAPYTDKRNMVLFPQFAAKSYTLILDYGGAEMTGSRSYDVSYGENLPELPVNLELEHCEFSGWYTEKDCGGTCVADEYGLFPDKSLVNERNFELDNSDGFIYLYAGFEAEKFTVKLNYDNGTEESIEVGYGTQASALVTDVRDADGRAVLTWSTVLDGSRPFTGSVTRDMVLYAAEWAPVIELDPNGGDDIIPVVAKEGTSVTVPTPSRKNYRFTGWQYAEGGIAEISVMPASGARLVASWQAMLVFDENGGTEVADISQETGTSVSLPLTSRAGYVFAGWYTADGEKYSRTSMPAASVELKAGWYRSRSKQKVFLNDGSYTDTVCREGYVFYDNVDLTINFRQEMSEVDWSVGLPVIIDFYADIKHNKHFSSAAYDRGELYATKEHIAYYSQRIVSDSYLLGETVLDHGNNSVNTQLTPMRWSEMFIVPESGVIYMALAADRDNYDEGAFNIFWQVGWNMTNFYATIYYPDISTLYL